MGVEMTCSAQGGGYVSSCDVVDIAAKKKAVEDGLAVLEAEKEAMKSHDASDIDLIITNNIMVLLYLSPSCWYPPAYPANHRRCPRRGPRRIEERER